MENEDIKSVLKKSLQKGYMLIIGALLLITIAIIYFTGGTGTLFKGQIALVEEEQAPPTFEIPTFPPTVISRVPAENSANISKQAGQVIVVFDEDNLTIDYNQNITVKKQGDQADLSTAAYTYTEANNTLQIPYLALEESTVYTVTIPAVTVKNEGIALNQDLNWSFTTQAPAEENPSPPEDPIPPQDPEENDDSVDSGENEEEITPTPTPPSNATEIKITEFNADPKGINPLINESKISYKISAKAKIEVKIIDKSGVEVVKLIDNKDIDKGEYYVWWNGTNKTDNSGEVVPPGTYTYKITAKDPVTGEVKDVKTGEINAIYQVASGDFENSNGSTTTTTEIQSNSTTKASVVSSQDASNIAATVSLQNAQNGVTAGTGTPVLIYVLLPVAGYLLTRKKSKI
jgi:hypothetical protein